MAAINEADMSVPMMKLENVPVPVSDVDRAKAFYEKVGFRLDRYAGFSDPDGNLWLLQEFPPEMRQPGQSFYKKEEDR